VTYWLQHRWNRKGAKSAKVIAKKNSRIFLGGFFATLRLCVLYVGAAGRAFQEQALFEFFLGLWVREKCRGRV
jgi:hypothetical protein